jgi:BirA family biotin operon repressor/biotin-[acetyl-CoA-carboxylase] ligase
VPQTASTNADLLVAARAGAPDRTVLVAEFQHGGRGRLGRSWSSPPGAGMTVSVLVRPAVPLSRWSWLPLLAGVALLGTVGGDARLKWPNDLLLGPDGRKVAGILVQIDDAAAPGSSEGRTDERSDGYGSGPAAVVGIGLNVSTTTDELPVPTATSLMLQGNSQLDRNGLMVELLSRFGQLYDAWVAAAGDATTSGLAATYRQHCATIDVQVAVDLPAGPIQGTAVGIDESGRLLVSVAGNDPIAVAAGDVTHLHTISR